MTPLSYGHHLRLNSDSLFGNLENNCFFAVFALNKPLCKIGEISLDMSSVILSDGNKWDIKLRPCILVIQHQSESGEQVRDMPISITLDHRVQIEI